MDTASSTGGKISTGMLKRLCPDPSVDEHRTDTRG
jgi:hypothetical protein